MRWRGYRASATPSDQRSGLATSMLWTSVGWSPAVDRAGRGRPRRRQSAPRRSPTRARGRAWPRDALSIVVSTRDRRGCAVTIGRGDERAPVRDAERVGHAQPHVPVDARAGVPARVGKSRVIHAHGDDVVRAVERHERRQRTLEARVAVRPAADEVSVDPHFGVVVDAVELDRDDLVLARPPAA